jgi:hypothetical protein
LIEIDREEILRQQNIPTIARCFPRPRPDHYKGGFPNGFEEFLWRLLGRPDPEYILHPFGGRAKLGKRCDINPETKPDYVCDAHQLPFEDDSWQVVVLDPPYSNDLSRMLYATGKLRPKVYIDEAIRVCEEGGAVVLYHWRMPTRPAGCELLCRIAIIGRPNHQGRICCVYRKQILKP